MTKLERYRGCLLAGGMGDQLGNDVEFMSHSRMLEVYGPDGVREMSQHITDDTGLNFILNGSHQGTVKICISLH